MPIASCPPPTPLCQQMGVGRGPEAVGIPRDHEGGGYDLAQSAIGIKTLHRQSLPDGAEEGGGKGEEACPQAVQERLLLRQEGGAKNDRPETANGHFSGHLWRWQEPGDYLWGGDHGLGATAHGTSQEQALDPPGMA